jgi:poly(A) polymerase
VLKGANQPKEHYWDVFEHSVEAMAAVEFLLRQRPWRYGEEQLLAVTPWSEEISRHFDEEVSGGSNRMVLLKVGALLHDIAKPTTKTVDETGKTRFLGHAKEGAAIAAAILERLRFSSREIRLVENLIYHHLRPAQMANGGMPSSRAIYRYFRDTEGAGIDVLFIALADYLATHGPELDIEEWNQHNQLINYVLAEHSKHEVEVLPVKLIDGHDLMDVFGLRPGRLVGELLTEVREAQVAGELSTRDEAIELVRKELEKRQCGMAC